MNPEPPLDAQALVDAIRGPSPTYKREAVDAIVAHREQTTPHLLAILQRILDDPRAYLDQMGDDLELLYALVLLAHFREAAAHEYIVRLARLPEPIIDELLGDFLTEELANVLLLTCGGQTDGMRAILLDRAANEYARGEAVVALVMAVGLGYAQRDEVLAFLAGLLVPEAAPEGPYLPSDVVVEMLLLHPVEHRETIRRAFEEGLVDPSIIGWGDVEQDLAAGPEEAAGALEERCQRALKDDVHDWLSWWAAFQEDAFERAPRFDLRRLAAQHQALSGQPERTVSKKDKAAAKKARKRQRAARKAQRKKR